MSQINTDSQIVDIKQDLIVSIVNAELVLNPKLSDKSRVDFYLELSTMSNNELFLLSSEYLKDMTSLAIERV